MSVSSTSSHNPFRSARSIRPWWTLLCLLSVQVLVAQEICDNGIDDDANGLVDLNDAAACPCSLLPPPVNLIANGSFEDHTCCPGTPGQTVSNYIDCATGWEDYQISADRKSVV